MKLALITDPRGFPVLDIMQTSYHLVLAQHIRSDDRYMQFYKEKSLRGDFIIMDNGAAEEGTLQLHELKEAAREISPDEIILPDVLGDKNATIAMSMAPDVLDFVPPRKRAVVPQGNDASEWLMCANYFVTALEFVTLCIPKHAERFPGGRPGLLKIIHKMGWHLHFNIHLLGIWGDPIPEVKALRNEAPWVRGLDSALPFALAQHSMYLEHSNIGHVSHTWGRKFDRSKAIISATVLRDIIAGDQ